MQAMMRSKTKIRARFALRPIACCVTLAFCNTALANPTGPSVAAGAAAFKTTGSTLSVTNAPGTIINWQSFSIGSAEHTRFLQQSASSAVLNRVVGADASTILGALSSNGRVFLVNPHGIVFGAGARIDTAGFIASTLNMRDSDFLQGKFKFEGGGLGVLRNEGVIRASGDIMLVGPQIENAGLIRSDNGSVLLAAGKSVTITSPDSQGVKFALQAPTDSALNVGTIEAANAAAMFAGTLRHTGEIRATTASLDGGRVVLSAQKDALVSGRIDATGSGGVGGAVQILGERVALQSGASIDASGTYGGGSILVGGDFQGKNPDVQNAWQTIVASGVTLRADAIAAGNGGKVIVWADDTTSYRGEITARGGAQSGDGGFVEVSGKRLLIFRGKVNTLAPNGKSGTLLLDPSDVTITTIDDPLVFDLVPGIEGFLSAPDADTEILFSDLQSALIGGNVVVTTLPPGGGGCCGDITIANGGLPLFSDLGENRTLTLDAFGNININGTVRYDPGVAGRVLDLILKSGSPGSNLTTNIRANINLNGGIIDATTGGSGIVNFPASEAGVQALLKANTINLSGGQVTFESAVEASALNLSAGSVDVRFGTLPRLNMTGGSVNRFNAGDLVITGPFTASGGTIGAPGDGGGRFVTEGPSNITGPVELRRGLLNKSTLSVTGTGQLDVTSSFAVIPISVRNEGTINLSSTAANPFGTDVLVPIENAGTINKAGAVVASVGARPFTNEVTGRLNVLAGTLVLPGPNTQSGVIVIGPGATLSTGGNSLTNLLGGRIGGGGAIDLGGGTLVNFGTLRAGFSATDPALPGIPAGPGTLSVVGDLVLNGSTIDGRGSVLAFGATTVAGDASTIASSLTTDAFTMAGGGLEILSGGALILTGSAPKLISGATLTNRGSVILAGTAETTLAGGAVWNNFGATTIGEGSRVVLDSGSFFNSASGDILLRSSSATPIALGGLATGSLINAGRITKDAGSAAVQTIDVPLTNTGTIDVDTGTLVASAFPSNSGVIDIASGATFSTGGSALESSGLLKGNGTLLASTFTNNGTVAPGNSPGGLTIAGNYVQGAGGTLEIELGGTSPITDFDQLKVTGSAALDGTLIVATASGSAIVQGTTYDVMTYGSRTGNFSSFTIPAQSTFVVTPGPTSYRLNAPLPSTDIDTSTSTVISTATTPTNPTTIRELAALMQKDSFILSERQFGNAQQIENRLNADSDDERKLQLEDCR